MNYRHVYHAGNFADVVKHVILIDLLEALCKKEKPFCFLDTHAGVGMYSLRSPQVDKQQEYQNGIAHLFADQRAKQPAIIEKYLAMIKNCHPDKSLYYYPGSPYFAKKIIRPMDKMILCELHPDDAEQLKTLFRCDEQVAVHHMDGYLAMKAFLPFHEKRGLVLIDPPFEKTDEFQQILRALTRALKRCPSGKYMVWYPVKNSTIVDAFNCAIKKLTAAHMTIHFQRRDMTDALKLNHCAILIINPPWKCRERLEDSILPYLGDVLNASWAIDS